MLDINLVRTEIPEVTVVPEKIRLMVRKLLDAEGIPYRQVYMFDQNNYQEDWPSIIVYNGKEYSDENYAFVTTVTRKSLFDAAEKLWLKGPEDIDEWEEEKKRRGE
jgi:hypothetical protein